MVIILPGKKNKKIKIKKALFNKPMFYTVYKKERSTQETGRQPKAYINV